MIGIDTNVLVRLFVRDDEAQFLRARSCIRSLTSEEPGFIPLVTLAELTWVMRSRYRTAKPVLVQVITNLLHTPAFVVEAEETVTAALRLFKDSSADFSDLLIALAAADAGCSHTVTFDEKAVANAGMRMVP